MKWEEHENGFLAQADHGFFFIYEEFERWYVEYEPGTEAYGNEESVPLVVSGFATLGKAKTAADKYSRDLEDQAELETREEE